MKTNREYIEAAMALCRWLESQDLTPGEATCVMAKAMVAIGKQAKPGVEVSTVIGLIHSLLDVEAKEMS